MVQNGIRAALVVCCLTGIGALATAAEYSSVVIRDVPHMVQKPDFCGEACVAMYLQRLGRDVDQDYVFDQSGLSPLQGRGCYTRELTTALQQIGFEPGPVWYQMRANQPAELEQHFAAMHADLVKGIPSIICMHYNDAPKTTEHFRLILGYDATSDEVLYHEPAELQGAYRRMARTELLKLWPLKYQAEAWTLIRFRLTGKQLAKGGTSQSFTAADYTQHIMKLRKKLPNENFHVIIEKPFVVIGDEAPEVVERRAANTIRWAVNKLKQDYFTQDPDEIIDIWLFKDKVSYETHAPTLVGYKPSTPFGFYSSRHNVLIMNISTGGGTLVHEIVHPFMASNFPACPSWFNEGLASLYEQCGEKDGHIYGYTNWRLAGLKQAVQRQRVPAFQTLCQTTTEEFYNEDPGTNYSQARYLCYYLQERDLLVKYYHAFRRSADNDPSGYSTLQKVLNENDMQDFKTRWEQFVMKLQ